MSKQIKRVLCVLCCLAILLLAAACDTTGNNNNNTGGNNTGNTGNNNTGNNNAGGNADGEDEGPDPFGKYEPTITVTTVRVVDANTKFEPGNPDRESLEKNLYARAYEEQLGIVFDYLWTIDGSEYVQKWNVTIASNDIPETAAVNETIYTMLLNGGYIEDMTDIFEAYASDKYREAQERDNGFAMSATIQNGRMMGLPHNGDMPEATSMLFIRKDWLDIVGKQAPKNVGDLIDIARAFKAAQFGGPDTYGIAMNKAFITGMFDIVGFMNCYGAYFHTWVEDSKGELVYGSTTAEMRNAVLALQSLYAEGLISQEAPISEWTKAMEECAQNKVGILFGSFAVPLMLASNTAMNPEAEWLILPIVTVDGSAPKPQSMMPRVSNFVFVKKGMKNPEAVVKLINLNLIIRRDPDYGTFDGYEQHKYAFCCEINLPGGLIDTHEKIYEALQTGDTSELDDNDMQNYNNVMAGLEGDRQNNFWMIFGAEPNSTFSIVRRNRDSRDYVVNKFQGRYSEFMAQNEGPLMTVLVEAISRVMMGEDISLFDKAVEDWYTGGGSQITQEVNDWYKANK